MLFWIVAAFLTLGACLAILMPVMRAKRSTQVDTDFDLEVYQDQLAELDKDIARGVINGPEAEQARAEIGRRILKLTGEKRRTGLAGAARSGRVVVTLAILALPLASWAIYAATGSPHLPGQPLDGRMTANPQEGGLAELVARAESHLTTHPEDGRGWDVLAPIYYRMGRYDDAAVAFRNAIRLAGASAVREAGLGEALAASAGGMITADAEAAFERALALEPANPKARFLLATGLAQEGRAGEAERAWKAMADDLPAESPWRGAVERALAELERVAGEAPLISDNEQAEMIDNMVAGLDQRLRDNPQDEEGWQRLIHSYVVLGRRDEATDALTRGLEALGRDSDAGEQLAAFAAERGIGHGAANRTGEGQ